jgi:hypothetical protein
MTTVRSDLFTDSEYQVETSRSSPFVAVGRIANAVRTVAVLLGGVSIFALTKSHNLLQERNLALTAAYAAVDGAFKQLP